MLNNISVYILDISFEYTYVRLRQEIPGSNLGWSNIFAISYLHLMLLTSFIKLTIKF